MADCLPSHLFSDLTLCYREEEIIITPRTQIQKSLEFILLFLSLHVYSLCGILHPQILDVLYFQVLIGIFILCVCPLYTEFNIFLHKETSLLSCQCLSVMSWAFLKCKLKGRSSCPCFKIKLYQVPLPLSEIPMPHFSPKYCFIILFSWLVYSIQVSLFRDQGPLKFSLISWSHITNNLWSIKLRVLFLPEQLCLWPCYTSPPPTFYLCLSAPIQTYHSRPISSIKASISPTHHNFSYLWIFTRFIHNFKTEWLKMFSVCFILAWSL